jgi:hypothetical protein
MRMGAAASTETGALPELRSADPAVLSRHTGARHRRCDVRAWNLNSWCTIAGNPFVGPVVLMPNPPGSEAVAAQFGPINLREGTDTMTFFLVSSDAHPHSHRLEVELSVTDRSQRTLASERTELGCGESACVTVTFGAAGPHGLSLRMAVSFAEFAGGDHYGNVRLNYLLAYEGNELIDLFNTAGSDKGTQRGIGQTGVPHCYAVDYFDLFKGFRQDTFRMLEIGLQSNEGDDYAPTDAPSLRVWHDFFPKADIYGYDINDFSFFEQDRTTVVRADQSSREDLARFVSEHAGEFRLILDDGSHAASHQQISLGALFPVVEPGGMYVIEDLHWQPFPETPTTTEVLREFIGHGQVRSPFLTADEARYLDHAIDRVQIHQPNDSEFAVIYKKPA